METVKKLIELRDSGENVQYKVDRAIHEKSYPIREIAEIIKFIKNKKEEDERKAS